MSLSEHFESRDANVRYGDETFKIYTCKYCGSTLWGESQASQHFELHHKDFLEGVAPEYEQGDLLYMYFDEDEQIRGVFIGYRRDDENKRYVFTVKWDDQALADSLELENEYAEAYFTVVSPDVVDAIENSLTAFRGEIEPFCKDGISIGKIGNDYQVVFSPKIKERNKRRGEDGKQ